MKGEPSPARASSKRSPRRAPLALAIAAANVAASLAGTASAASSGQSEPGPIETVEVLGERHTSTLSSDKFARPLLDTAQTVNVVPESLIRERAATSLRDVLRNVSGISMQAGEGGAPAGDQLSIRGYSVRTDIFVDGVRDFGGYTRDPFNLEQVEVVKGPSSDYSGRGSTGGSINLVSKAPSLVDASTVDLALGTDEFSRATLDANHRLGSFEGAAARLNLLYHEQDVAGRDQVYQKRWGVAPSLAFGLESDTQVIFSLFHLNQDNLPDYGIPWVPDSNVPLAEFANEPPPVDFDNWYGLLARDFEDVKTSLATIQVEHRISESATLSNTTRYGVTDRDSMITAPRFLEDSSTLIRRSDEKYRDDVDDILSNQTNLTVDVSGRFEHRLLVGVELTQENEKRNTRELTGTDSPPTDLFDPTPDDPYLENYQPTGTASRAEANTVAAYLSDSVALSDRWLINGALRWDRFEIDFTPDGEPTLARTDKKLSYRAGVVFKPVEQGSIFLGYGTSFNPTAEGLSISTSSRSPGIARLDPEKNRTLEFGAKWQFPGVFLSGAVFQIEKTNARTQDPNNPDDLLVLEGEQRVRGLELGVAGQVFDRVQVFAGYTYLDTEVTESRDPDEIGNQLSNAPRHSFNWWGTYQATDALQLGFGGQFVDERFNNLSNTRQAPSFWTYELFAGYELSESVSLRLNVQNVGDEEYVDFVGGGHFIPGAGRLAMLRTTVRF